jgi:hypothetical protein
MRTILRIALLLASTALVGCGGGSDSTDPTKLPPLTEADFAEIRQRDQSIVDEENGIIFVEKGKGKLARNRSSQAAAGQ